MSAPTPATQPVKTKSKAYSSTVAIQGDAAKYRLKYKELKKKVREIEVENDKLHLKTLGIKRNIQRMRLERAILYERLDAESRATPGVASYPPYEREDPYAAQGSNRGERLRQYTESASPEPARRGASPPVEAGLPPSSSRSAMKVTLRRGA
uniref:INO80 complex subunit F domain-containing protein n=1 Tax=Kalmanozyma brasiliensis (strain GHG001) TaxID=1365824 RepID=V5F0G9_KALBG